MEVVGACVRSYGVVRIVGGYKSSSCCGGCACFFFSSRRRHTRFDCDWSSDVCSSDLRFYKTRSLAARAVEGGKVKLNGERVKPGKEVKVGDEIERRSGELHWLVEVRSEERRVGKEGRSRWSPYH